MKIADDERVSGVAPSNTNNTGHLVQFYESHEFLTDAVAGFLGDGLAAGSACLLIATPAHRAAVERHLEKCGISVRTWDGYLALDAAELLSRFIVSGALDEELFSTTVGGLVEQAARAGKRVRVFGEMVALLWQRRERAAALRLEELWNGLGKRLPLLLLCGYPVDLFGLEPDRGALLTICSHHSGIIPAESYTALTDDAQLRSVIQLQHQAKALTNERMERRKVQASLDLREQELADFLEYAAEGVQQVDADGRVLWANQTHLDVLGYALDEYIGHHFSEFWPARERFDEYWRMLTGGATVTDFATALRCKDGSVREVLIRSNGFWRDGQFLYTRSFIRDLTERVRLENELRTTIARLAEEDRHKDEFLAMLAHELRNPLAAIMNALAVVNPDDTRQTSAAQIARRQTEQLSRIIDDLLDVARITRGKISLQKETVRIGDVVERALEQARHLISARHHHLTVSISPAAKAAQVNADPARLQQVIGNLIDNAAKFTPFGGRIELIVTCADQAVIQVRDNGEGIAPEMLPHIFDLFRQADASLDRAHGGLGMGLTLAKQLVEMHHGRLEARSGGRGRGSEFEIRLPLDKGQTRADERAVAPGASLTALRVLIVDDNFDAAESLKALIELLGHQAHIAADGDAALTAIDSAEFKLALVDIGLPGMDGYELARRLRTLRGGAELTLCAERLSEGGAATRKTAAGFDRHFVKPLKIEALETPLAEICQSDREAAAEVREPPIPRA